MIKPTEQKTIPDICQHAEMLVHHSPSSNSRI